jgi:uncharacterized protein (DUF885 family)
MKRVLFGFVSLCALASACSKGGDRAAAPETDAAPVAAGEPAADAAAVSAAFDAKVDELTRIYFAELPEMATYNGAPATLAPGADAKLNDRSQEAEVNRRAAMERELAALKAVDDSTLDHRRKLTHDILVTQLENALGPTRAANYGSMLAVYGSWFAPYAVMQNSGPVVDVPNLMNAQQAVTNAEQAEAFLARLSAYGAMLEGVTGKVRHDAGLGVTPPDFILAKTRGVIAGFITPAPAENMLVASFAKKLADANVAGAEDFTVRAAAIVERDVYPASRRLADYLGELEKTASHDAGIWRLPNGLALYQAMIRQMTDTDLSADEIHQIGLDEVARIHGEMDAILKSQGYAEGPVGERMQKLGEEQRFFYANTPEGKAEILADIQKQLDEINKLVPQYFGLQPKYAVEVRAVPEFSQDSAPGGYYDSPALDGSRPGIYWINLRDTAIWPRFALPTLTYHEAVPGHHLQGALALGQDQPLILNVLYSNAYGEGWALYSEALAKEMGLYADDPFGDLGRLQDELHRAIRLVVDTGIHAKKWSREQAIEYMATTEGAHPEEVESEIERYIVWPGQALGYKMGMLKIQEIRKNAEAELGDKFDIRAFHDVVLKDGPVPIPVLEANVKAWVAEANGSSAPASP